MRGSITARGRNTWRLRYEGPPSPDGLRKRVSETVKGTKGEAHRILRERLSAIEQGKYVPRKKETVATFMESWLAHYASTHTGPKTYQGYRQKVNSYVIPCLGSVQIQGLNARHIRELHRWMLDKGLSNQTVVHAHTVFSGALESAVDEGIISSNPAKSKAARPPKPEPQQVVVWDMPTLRRFLDAAKDSPFSSVFKLAILTGLRRSELTGLTWSSVDLDSATLRVTATLQRITGKGLLVGEPKSRAGKRPVALDQSSIDLLHSIRGHQLSLRAELGDLYQNPRGYVFTNELGAPLDSDRLSREFARIKTEADLPSATFHCLRHCHVSFLLDEGASMRLIADRVGHADPSLTLRDMPIYCRAPSLPRLNPWVRS